MRLYTFCTFSTLVLVLLTGKKEIKQDTSPLAAYSTEWNNERFSRCNTAANAGYLTDDEKEIIYILNLVRTDPKLFASTVLPKYPAYTDQKYIEGIREYKSLRDTLRKLNSLNFFYPDSLCFISAKCHAVSSGQAAAVGHDRKTAECKAKKNYYGECCDYGHSEPLIIVMSLLVDQDVPTLGHRFILLSDFEKIGVSIQPHKSFGYNAVLDLR